jgi:hypothetical protein
MNHDELRSKIQHYNWVEATDLIKALDAVVKLHKPVMAFTGGYDGEENELWAEQCQECSGNGFSQMYPCTTIQAIEKELK